MTEKKTEQEQKSMWKTSDWDFPVEYKRSYALIKYKTGESEFVAFNCEADKIYAEAYYNDYHNVSAKDLKKKVKSGKVFLWEGNCVKHDELLKQPKVYID